MNKPPPTAPPRKRRRGLRLLLGIPAGLIALLLVAYFVLTSSAFFKGVVLPRVSRQVGAKVTVAEASIHPFSEVRLTGLKVQTTGENPLLTSQEVAVKYSLWGMLRGRYRIESISIVKPALELTQNADGTSNLDPILEALAQMSAETEPPPSEPTEAGAPPQVELAKLSIQNAHIRVIRHHTGDQRDVLEVEGLGLTLEGVKNGGTAALSAQAGLNVDLNPPPPGAAGALQSRLSSEFKLRFSKDLQPTQIQGAARIEVAQAAGALAGAQNLALSLETDITPEAVRQAALRAFQGQTALAELTCSGPFDFAKQEGQLTISARGIDRRLLNLAGAAAGVDFGKTSIESTNVLTLAKQAQAIQLAGALKLRQFSLTRSNLTTPPLDLSLNYDLDTDLAAGRAVLRKLSVNGRQKNQPLLTGGLVKPMTLDWSSGQAGPEESALSLTLTNLNLADWAQFTGGMAAAGQAAARMDVTSRQAGRELTLLVDGRLAGLRAAFGTNAIEQLDLTFHLDTQIAEFQRVALRQAKLEVAHAGRPLASATARGNILADTLAADLQTTLELQIPPALKLAALPDADFTSGALACEAHVVQQPAAGDGVPVQILTGKFTLRPLSGRYAEYALDRFAAEGEFDVQMQGTQAAIRKLTSALSHAGQSAGQVSLNGRWDLEANRGEIKLAARDVNERLLAPFLQPALQGKELRSAALAADASVRFDPATASTIAGSLSLSNFVMRDPAGALPETPLAARVRWDVAMSPQAVEVRSARLELDRTERAENAVDLTGKIDLKDANAITGNLKLAAASLDVTPWYDLFMGKTSPESASAPAPSPETEPPAVQLPLKNFAMSAEVQQFYLHEVVITNLTMNVMVDGGHITVKPARLDLNGAPVEGTADLDLGVPGYRYDVSLQAKDVPLAPLVNSFQPDRKGQIEGTVTAGGALRGAGVTGPSLQKNLAGQFQFAAANMNLKAVHVRSSILKSILNVIIGLPDLIRNPQEAVTGLVGKLTDTLSGQKSKGPSGWVDEVAQSPINIIESNGRIGEGVVQLERAFVQSPAFQIETHGTIRLAAALTNSTLDLPVNVALRRELAAKVGLAPPDASTNIVFVQLPQFLTMQGTVSEPKKKLNVAALLQITSKVAAGLVGNTGGTAVDQAVGAAEAIGGLFGGKSKKGSSTNAAPALPKLPINPFKLFDRK